MSYNRLSGFRYIDEIRDHYDVFDRPGAYVFYKTVTGPPRYVGRSDFNLYKRIRGRDWEYLYYRFKHCRNDYSAYRWECKYYHRFYYDLRNKIHPRKPTGSSIQCPVCFR